MVDGAEIGSFVQSSHIRLGWLPVTALYIRQPALERLTRLTSDQIIGSDWRNFVLEDDRSKR
jgi:hypothetical protein